ncbi:WD40 repeat domain-containing protein [Leisingera sp. SS27]|uniref:WD40 repeat domain-containing protein n=1 Tax=Leisingera sp. SS27 TaxID=2979462 RepID=UPI0023301207|nr:WD40 repeat domain-containing protein [Leisingera sp. SS27]MDC0656531.1 WD40 repeat domain-containing protein [Leisingera sp. SS27]
MKKSIAFSIGILAVVGVTLVVTEFDHLNPVTRPHAENGKRTVEIKAGNLSNVTYSFSPDATLFVHSLEADRYRGYLEIRNAETGDLVARSDDNIVQSAVPSWYTATDGEPGLFVPGVNDTLVKWDGIEWSQVEIDGLDWGLASNSQGILSPDGRFLTAANFRSSGITVNLETNEVVELNHGHRQTHLASWSPDGSLFATGHDGQVVIYEGRHLKVKQRYKQISSDVYEASIVNELKWSPSGKYLIIGTLYGASYIVEPGNRTVKPRPLAPEADMVFTSEWLTKPDQSWFAKWLPPKDQVIYNYLVRDDNVGRVEGLAVHDADSGEVIRDFPFPQYDLGEHPTFISAWPDGIAGVISAYKRASSGDVDFYIYHLSESGPIILDFERKDAPNNEAPHIVFSEKNTRYAVRYENGGDPFFSIGEVRDLLVER